MNRAENQPVNGHDMIEYPDGAADNLRWTKFKPRPGDIIISTPPKAGTTLTQMLCALVVFDGLEFPGPLDDFSPWFDQITRNEAEALALVEDQNHRRILKTHTPLDGIPRFDDVTFISVHRDPRDVFMSWIHHVANIDRERITAAIKDAGYLDRLLANRQDQPDTWDGRFDLWLELPWKHSVFALERIARHVVVATDRRGDPNVTLLHFADVRDNPIATMTTLAEALDLERPRDRLRELAPQAGIDRMRSKAADFAPVTKGQLSDPINFFRSGIGGEWRELISPTALKRYDDRAAQLLTADQRRWLERDSSRPRSTPDA